MSSRYSSRRTLYPKTLRNRNLDPNAPARVPSSAEVAAQGKLTADYASKKARYSLLGVELPNEPAGLNAPVGGYGPYIGDARGRARTRAIQKQRSAQPKVGTEKVARDSGVGNATLDEDVAFRKKLLRKALKRGLPSVQTDKTALA